MTIVNSCNEWDPLKHVIVGTVENSNHPPKEPALEPKISKDSGMVGSHGPRSQETIEKANIQKNIAKSSLESNYDLDLIEGAEAYYSDRYGWTLRRSDNSKL